jgi:RNA polymerase sigma-70 factor (ECF subfamily)
MSDGSLAPAVVERARRGDPHAFRQLYEHHVEAVHGFLIRLLRDATAAQDALQDTFMRVLRGLPRFDPSGPARLSTWILVIARRVALDALDRRRLEHANGRAGDPERGEAVPDLRIALEAAVAALPAAQRTVFVLYEGTRLSYEEIALVEGVDVGTVKSRLHRARLELKERVEQLHQRSRR